MKVVTLDSIVSVIRARRGYRGFLAEFINECKIADAIPIPEGATNGYMIKAMYPDAQIDYHEKSDLVDAYVTVFIKGCDTCQDYSYDWWNSPFKPSQTLEHADQSGMELADMPTLQSAT